MAKQRDQEPRRTFRLDRHSRDDARAAVDEELTHHLALLEEELVSEGWTPDEARREAARRFGDVDGTRADLTTIQERRGRMNERGRILEELGQDLRWAMRSLRHAPGYAALVVLTLAFGIAANTVIFSVMNPYLFRPLPFGEAEELAHIAQVNPVTGWHMDRFSLPIVQDWADRSQGLEALAAYAYRGGTVTGPEGAEGINFAPVSANLLEVLRVQPVLGRGFVPEDGGPGAEPVALLDHGFWQRRYLGDPGIVGRSITLDGVAHTVVGIMPPRFAFPFNRVVLWTPLRESAAAADRAGPAPYLAVGRMAPGWDRERLDGELTRIQSELGQDYPDADGRWAGVTVLPMRQALNFAWDVLTLTFSIMLGAVAFVLAIACVNVASLTLARASTRVRDLSVRSAMGASRGRIVRQLLTESTLLALVGGVVGVGLAAAAVAVVGPLLPPDLFRVGEARLDGTVLAFTVAVTLATPLIFGLAPALATTRKDLARGLKAGSKSSGGLAASRGRKALVTVQVALAVVLLAGAGLMIRSFAAVQEMELGFEAERVLFAEVVPPQAAYDLTEVRAFTREAMVRLEALPEVASASAASFIPLNHETSVWQFNAPERAGAPGEEWPTAVANRSWPGYPTTLGIPLLAGRDFGPGDDLDGPPVVLVSQSLAERLWTVEQAVGRTLLLGDPDDPVETTVVGVVGTVVHQELGGERPGPQVYRPILQSTTRRHYLVARTEGDPAALSASVRRALTALDPDLAVTVQPMSAVLRENQLQWSLGSAFLGVFGGGALLLATLGIYGLIAFSVAQRRREMGIRMALGASARGIRWTVVRDGVVLTATGLGVGLVGALVVGRAIAAALYGVSPFDPVTLIVVLVLFPAVAALASWLPAVRASRTDPVGALRSD